MWIIGLTGAMGAGKSWLSKCFRQLGVPVHCADSYVHFLLEKDPDVRQKIKNLWPDVFVKGKIDRLSLGNRVLYNPSDLNRLEEIIYPKLAKNQKLFLQKNQYRHLPMVVLDIPLLFEVGLKSYCDYVITSSAPPYLRKVRVLSRKGMSEEKFYTLEKLQTKEYQRRKKADFIVYTGRDKGNALRKIKQIFFDLSQRSSPKWQGKWPKELKKGPL